MQNGVKHSHTVESMLNLRRLWVTVFWMRLLYDAFPAAFRHRSLSSMRQQIWSVGPLESSSPVLKPFILSLFLSWLASSLILCYFFFVFSSLWHVFHFQMSNIGKSIIPKNLFNSIVCILIHSNIHYIHNLLFKHKFQIFIVYFN